MLRDDIAKYTELTGEDGAHVPIIKLGAFLDGYERGSGEVNNVLDKISAEIEPKCDRINSLASVLPYTAHREIQELLCEIMTLCKAESIGELPPVNLTKTGRWILIDKELSRYKCSECGEVIKLYKKSEVSKLEKDETLSDYPFSHCGAKMIEPQKSEE